MKNEILLILLMNISDDGNKVERVTMGRDDGEFRVIYQDKDGKYRVRALIELKESHREHYDKIVCDTLLETVIACEKDISECYSE
tara:strand:- start:1706 stop:1960 length:255 start_codon:yes stop_codon:yes gene_type:complete